MTEAEQFMASIEALKTSNTRIERDRLLAYLVTANIRLPEGKICQGAGAARSYYRSESGTLLLSSRSSPPALTAQASADLNRYRALLNGNEVSDPAERKRLTLLIKNLRGF